MAAKKKCLLTVVVMVTGVVGMVTPSTVLPDVTGIPGTGRQLYVRSLQGVDGFQSDLFEIFMEPYGYEQRPVAAVAVLSDSSGLDEIAKIRGELVLVQPRPPHGPVRIQGNITGLPPGPHGLHVHTSGDTRDACARLRHHFNPHHLQHGGPDDALRHAGDLGNVVADGNGAATVDILVGLSLGNGPRSVLGRAVGVTVNGDDLGKGGTADSVTDGSGGKVLACGIIALLN